MPNRLCFPDSSGNVWPSLFIVIFILQVESNEKGHRILLRWPFMGTLKPGREPTRVSIANRFPLLLGWRDRLNLPSFRIACSTTLPPIQDVYDSCGYSHTGIEYIHAADRTEHLLYRVIVHCFSFCFPTFPLGLRKTCFG